LFNARAIDFSTNDSPRFVHRYASSFFLDSSLLNDIHCSSPNHETVQAHRQKQITPIDCPTIAPPSLTAVGENPGFHAASVLPRAHEFGKPYEVPLTFQCTNHPMSAVPGIDAHLPCSSLVGAHFFPGPFLTTRPRLYPRRINQTPNTKDLLYNRPRCQPWPPERNIDLINSTDHIECLHQMSKISEGLKINIAIRIPRKIKKPNIPKTIQFPCETTTTTYSIDINRKMSEK
jgi:hypothetical protein